MMNLPLASVSPVMKIVISLWVLIGVILVLVVLIQKGRGGGLSSAFGGIGSSLLGTKTGDFLTWVTISLVAVWLLLSVAAAKWFKPQEMKALQTEQRPIATMPAEQAEAPLENQSSEQPAEIPQDTAAETTEPNLLTK